MGRPDIGGREEILKVHAKNKPLGDDVDLQQIAQTTAGFTGADLENLLNEAAIVAAREDRAYIVQADIRRSFVKVGIGAEKKSRIISDKEKKITAYHDQDMRSYSMYFRMSDRYIPYRSYRPEQERQDIPCHYRKKTKCLIPGAECYRRSQWT